MGSYFSTSVTHSADISGSHVNLWIINGVKFNISSILNEVMQNAVERFENIMIENNESLIINTMLILTIIILLIMFLYLRRRYQQVPTEINFNNYPLHSFNEFSMSNNKSLSMNIPKHVEGYLV